VSPEQSEDGVMPPVAENSGNGVAQAQQIITQHATAGAEQQQQQQQRQQQRHYQPQAQQQQQQQQPLMMAPAAPLAAQPPMMAPAGMPMPPAPAPPAPFSHSGAGAPHLAPPPAAMGNNMGVAHNVLGVQNNSTVNVNVNAPKRRRVDVPVMAMSMSAGPTSVLSDPMAVAAALQGRGRKKTQAQIDRRRERNRILARRTRLRKKFFFESLQKQVMDLQRENAALKEIVKEELAGEEGSKLLSECNASEKLPQAVLEACGEQAADMDQQDFNLVRSIQQSQHCFVITDPSLPDNPIVFASDDFLSLTGYTKDDVLGRNCRFLQGTESNQDKVQAISKGLSNGEDVSVTLINYTADGTPFWNKLFIAALRDAQDNIVNFIGVVVKVASPEPGDPEHDKRLPGEQQDGNDHDGDDTLDDYADGEKMDSDTAALVADGTVRAIEGAVDAAVAAASAALG
jgi:PAS domain S-box-containing protein